MTIQGAFRRFSYHTTDAVNGTFATVIRFGGEAHVLALPD